MLFLLNTVSYPAMALPFMIEEERNFYNSKAFLDAQKRERRNNLMAVIYQTMRSGKRLPMFAPHHRIQPPKVDDVAAV